MGLSPTADVRGIAGRPRARRRERSGCRIRGSPASRTHEPRDRADRPQAAASALRHSGSRPRRAIQSSNAGSSISHLPRASALDVGFDHGRRIGACRLQYDSLMRRAVTGLRRDDRRPVGGRRDRGSYAESAAALGFQPAGEMELRMPGGPDGWTAAYHHLARRVGCAVNDGEVEDPLTTVGGILSASRSRPVHMRMTGRLDDAP